MRQVSSHLLHAFAKLRKVAISSVMSVFLCLPGLSVSPHGITRLPLVTFSWHLMSEYFSKIRGENSRYIKIWQEWRILYLKTNKRFWSHLAQLFLEWEMFQTKVVEKVKPHILRPITYFLQKSCRLWDNAKRNIVEPDRR